jgi:hypothetical protein
MSTLKCLVAIVGWLIAAYPSFADDREKVIGIWKLVSQEIEIQATGQKEPVMGRSPTGYAIFSREVIEKIGAKYRDCHKPSSTGDVQGLLNGHTIANRFLWDARFWARGHGGIIDLRNVTVLRSGHCAGPQFVLQKL